MTTASANIEAELLQLRDSLRLLGYAAKVVNGDCFDIHQGGAIHYLSKSEAEALLIAGVGVDLMDHSERRGLNRWYSFEHEQREDGER